MTAATVVSTTESVKNFKGGWKDAGLRAAGSRVNLSQPLERSYDNPVWDRVHHQPVPDEDGHVRSGGGMFAFEVCARCGWWSGRAFKILDDGSKYGEAGPATRPPCACPHEGDLLSSVPAVALTDLPMNGLATGVLTRAGVDDTHDACELGYLAMYGLPGVGMRSVDALRAAVVEAGLPELQP